LFYGDSNFAELECIEMEIKIRKEKHLGVQIIPAMLSRDHLYRKKCGEKLA